MAHETLTAEDIDILTNVIPELNLVPENAPEPEQLDQWNKMVDQTFHKVNAKDKTIDKRVFYVVDNLFPQSNTSDGKYTVTYRFHVYVHLGFARSKAGEILDGRDNRPKVYKLAHHDFFVDVKKFILDYRLAD